MNRSDRFKMPDHVRALPQLSAFLTQVETIHSDGHEGSFWRCETLFRDLCRSSFFSEFLNHQMECLIESPVYIPAAVATENEMLIYQSDQITFVLKYLSCLDAHSRLFGRSEHYMIAILSDEHVKLDLYHQPHVSPNEVF